MSGLVVRVHVGVGDEVTVGQTLIVLESMKIEIGLQSEVAGLVTELHVAVGAQVTEGAPLVTVRPHP